MWEREYQKQKSGHITTISSSSGKFGFFLRSSYSASKFAQVGFFESLRLEEEKNNILFASVLVTFAYLPILYAYTKINVPSVAALREISILFTSIYGVYFLKEKFGLVKVISAVLVVIGCVIIRTATG